MEKQSLFFPITFYIWLFFHAHIHSNSQERFQTRSGQWYPIVTPYSTPHGIQHCSGIAVGLLDNVLEKCMWPKEVKIDGNILKNSVLPHLPKNSCTRGSYVQKVFVHVSSRYKNFISFTSIVPTPFGAPHPPQLPHTLKCQYWNHHSIGSPMEAL